MLRLRLSYLLFAIAELSCTSLCPCISLRNSAIPKRFSSVLFLSNAGLRSSMHIRRSYAPSNSMPLQYNSTPLIAISEQFLSLRSSAVAIPAHQNYATATPFLAMPSRSLALPLPITHRYSLPFLSSSSPFPASASQSKLRLCQSSHCKTKPWLCTVLLSQSFAEHLLSFPLPIDAFLGMA